MHLLSTVFPNCLSTATVAPLAKMFIIQKFLKRKSIHRSLQVATKNEKLKTERTSFKAEGCTTSKKGGKKSPEFEHVQYSNSEIEDIRKMLSPVDMVALKVSWKRLKGTTGLRNVTPVLMKVFDKTFKRIPSAKHFFALVAFGKSAKDDGVLIETAYEHSTKLARFLDFLILGKCPASSEKYTPTNIGKVHASMENIGFVGEIWEVFGRCFADVMVSNDIVRACPKGPRAWNLFVAILTDQLRAGYDQQLRNMLFQRSQGKLTCSSSLDQMPPGQLYKSHKKALELRIENGYFDTNSEVYYETFDEAADRKMPSRKISKSMNCLYG